MAEARLAAVETGQCQRFRYRRGPGPTKSRRCDPIAAHRPAPRAVVRRGPFLVVGRRRRRQPARGRRRLQFLREDRGVGRLASDRRLALALMGASRRLDGVQAAADARQRGAAQCAACGRGLVCRSRATRRPAAGRRRAACRDALVRQHRSRRPRLVGAGAVLSQRPQHADGPVLAGQNDLVLRIELRALAGSIKLGNLRGSTPPPQSRASPACRQLRTARSGRRPGRPATRPLAANRDRAGGPPAPRVEPKSRRGRTQTTHAN